MSSLSRPARLLRALRRVQCLPCSARCHQSERSSGRHGRSFQVPVQRIVVEISCPPLPDGAQGGGELPGTLRRGQQGSSDVLLHLVVADGRVARCTLGDRVRGVCEWLEEGEPGYDCESFACLALSRAPCVLVSSLANIEQEPRLSKHAVAHFVQQSAALMADARRAISVDALTFAPHAGQRSARVSSTTTDAALRTASQLILEWAGDNDVRDIRDVLITVAIVDGWCGDDCRVGAHLGLRLQLLLSLCSGGDVDARGVDALQQPHASIAGRRPGGEWECHEEPRNFRLNVLVLSNDPAVERVVRSFMRMHPHHSELSCVSPALAHDDLGSGHEHLVAVVVPQTDVDCRKTAQVERMHLLLKGHAGARAKPVRTAKSAKAATSVDSAPSTPSSRKIVWWLARVKGGSLRKGKNVADAYADVVLANPDERAAMELFDLVSVVDTGKQQRSRAKDDAIDVFADIADIQVAGWAHNAGQDHDRAQQGGGHGQAAVLGDLFPSLLETQRHFCDRQRAHQVRAHTSPARVQCTWKLTHCPPMLAVFSGWKERGQCALLSARQPH